MDVLKTSWEEKKIKFLVSLVNENAENSAVGKPYIGLENVQSKTAKLIGLDIPLQVNGLSNLFYKYNVLFGKLRPYLAKSFIATFDGRCSSEFLVLKVGGDILPSFLNYAMLSDFFIDDVNSSTYGAKMPRANWEYIGNMSLAVPSIELQKIVCDYLDGAVSKIDAVIEKKQKLLELLKDKRQALIDEAVTKGLDRGTPMRDSGIEWLGVVPAHWSLDKIGRAFTVDMGKMNQSESNTQSDKYIRYLKSINVQWFSCDYKSEQFMWCNPNEFKKINVKSGDLLVCEGGEVGRACIVEEVSEEMIVEKSLHRIRSTEKANNKYLLYVLKTIASFGWFDVLCNKSTIAHLTAEKLKQIKVPLPPINEQREIVTYLESTTEKIDTLILKINTQIEKFQEYRQSLISEAVTGKIDVRNYAKEVVE